MNQLYFRELVFEEFPQLNGSELDSVLRRNSLVFCKELSNRNAISTTALAEIMNCGYFEWKERRQSVVYRCYDNAGWYYSFNSTRFSPEKMHDAVFVYLLENPSLIDFVLL